MTTPSTASSHQPPLAVADAVERVAASVVALRTRRGGTSSALAWRPRMLVAAASAIGHAPRAQVVLANGEATTAEVRGIDLATDVAVLTIAADVPVPERHVAPAVRVGDFVFATGRDASGSVHASFGYVGAAGEAWRTWRGGRLDRLVRLDGGLYPGLVGAPVADVQGQVLGLASAAFSRHHGVVVPATTIDRVADALLAHGRVQRGHLGIVTQPVTLSTELRGVAQVDSATALLLAGIAEEGPAARAGLMVGDILVAAGGRALDSIDALRDLLAGEPVGARLRLVLLRGGRREELTVEIGEQPAAGRC